MEPLIGPLVLSGLPARLVLAVAGTAAFACAWLAAALRVRLNALLDVSPAREAVCAVFGVGRGLFIIPVTPGSFRPVRLLSAPAFPEGEKVIVRFRDGYFRLPWIDRLVPTGLPLDEDDGAFIAAASAVTAASDEALRATLRNSVLRHPAIAGPEGRSFPAALALLLAVALSGLLALAAADVALDRSVPVFVSGGVVSVSPGPLGFGRLVRLASADGRRFVWIDPLPSAGDGLRPDADVLLALHPGFFRVPWLSAVRPEAARGAAAAARPSDRPAPEGGAGELISAWSASDPAASRASVLACAGRGDLRRALDLAEIFTHVFPDDAAFIHLAADLAERCGEPEYALLLAARGRERFPADPRFGGGGPAK